MSSVLFSLSTLDQRAMLENLVQAQSDYEAFSILVQMRAFDKF